MEKLKERQLKKNVVIDTYVQLENKEKKQNKNFYKNQNGSITLFILLSCLFFLIVVVSVSAYLKNKETSIDEQYQSIKKSYEKNVGDEETVYNEKVQSLWGGEAKKTAMPAVSETETTLDRTYGTIDLVFLQGTGYKISETPNAPALDNTMVPVKYDTSTSNWIVCSTTDTEWYSYAKQTDGADGKTSKWANVMLTDDIVVEKNGTSYDASSIKTLLTSNSLNTIVGATVTTEGSMLVWIPRYAYKITYFDSETNKNAWIADNSSTAGIIGYSDSRGIVTKDGETPSDYNTPTTSLNINGMIGITTYEYYRPHPAFEDGSSTGFTQGEWNLPLTGIWVGKFEATGDTSAVTINSSTVALKNETIGTLWQSIKDNFKAGTTGSHMMKNSEWGAVSYLAQSSYGRNGATVTINADTGCYTGGASTVGAYKNNTTQSTTGNVYGIYDTVGGTFEYVASYIANSTKNYGYQFASKDGESTSKNDKEDSTRYATVYKYNSTSDTNVDNYISNVNKIFGDGTIETSTSGSGKTSWNSASSSFVNTSSPFFRRGGHYNSSGPGLFCFGNYGGNANSDFGSRVVCIVK